MYDAKSYRKYLMTEVSTIGILGGMGPAATNLMAALITKLTEADSDQEHIPVITYNNPRIPDRLDAILYDGTSPVDELKRTALILQQAGADFIIMPSISAHAFLEPVRASVRVPVLDMISLCASHIQGRNLSKVGIIATNAALRANLFQQASKDLEASILYPSPSDQAVVMDAIYGDYGVKAGHVQRGFLRLRAIAQTLAQYGAEAVVAACSEVSVAFHECHDEIGVAIIDPMIVTANLAVSLARQGFRQDSKEVADSIALSTPNSIALSSGSDWNHSLAVKHTA